MPQIAVVTDDKCDRREVPQKTMSQKIGATENNVKEDR